MRKERNTRLLSQPYRTNGIVVLTARKDVGEAVSPRKARKDVLICLHSGCSKDLRTGRLLDGIWHRWMVTGNGIERIWDGRGEADGMGVTKNVLPPDRSICPDCNEIIFDDIRRMEQARFYEVK